jgi:tRNA(His) 5'-end guanylyltransferase
MKKIRSEMLKKGLNASGISAHEAEIYYLQEIGFSEIDIEFANQLRYFRNGIEYYGKGFNKEYAEKVLNFLEKIREKVKL